MRYLIPGGRSVGYLSRNLEQERREHIAVTKDGRAPNRSVLG
jgi:hypothetical protein